MTYQEAKEWLGKQKHNFPTLKEAERDQECRKVINEALEKQIPKKPTGNKLNCCPRCKGLVGINTNTIHAKYNYCNHCGQAIDWSDE